VEDYDAVELNEAFAAQVLACDRDLHFNRERLNPKGGAIGLGHPIAATGSLILTTLIHEVRRPSGQEDGRGASPRTGRRGLATLCASGGLGVAAEIETV
jgi:acetyl-CoA C-acetyltransferase